MSMDVAPATCPAVGPQGVTHALGNPAQAVEPTVVRGGGRQVAVENLDKAGDVRAVPVAIHVALGQPHASVDEHPTGHAAAVQCPDSRGTELGTLEGVPCPIGQHHRQGTEALALRQEPQQPSQGGIGQPAAKPLQPRPRLAHLQGTLRSPSLRQLALGGCRSHHDASIKT
jgi:hypothetical protein